MFIKQENLFEAIKKEPRIKDCLQDKEKWSLLVDLIERNVLFEFLGQIIRLVDEIVEIDPDLPEPRILEKGTRYIVEFLHAHSSSVRIYDPQTAQMLSYGSYPSGEDSRKTYIPLEGSVAGEVIKTREPYLVPDILNEKLYHNKSVIDKGVNSLMVIPLEITRFSQNERDTVGVIQIYFREKGRNFTPLEIQVAKVMSKRLSFVIARKKILSMRRVNEKKEAIVRHIFRNLGARGGIKMKEVFNRMIPELADIVNLQSCSLFSVTDDYTNVVLEAGYPEERGYHGIGKTFPVNSVPSFELLLNLRDYSGESAYEIITSSYLLVLDIQRSELISSGLREFADLHNINSILYIPLNVDGEIRYLLVFDALDQKKRYTDDEIDIFLFMGRELIKAQKMERLDDALHDFKNPAIATAGFAKRLKKLLEKNRVYDEEGEIHKCADILLEETTRLQQLSMGLYKIGKAQEVNFSNLLRRRFEINEEAINEQLRKNVTLKEGPFDYGLKVRCFPIHLERVFDNLLNNATKAIPIDGGILTIRTYAEGEWACAEITNTGHISEANRLRILEGEGEGRGIYIIHRIMRLLKGSIDIQRGEGTTTFVVRLPIFSKEEQENNV